MSRPAAIRWPWADLDQALRHAGYHTRIQKLDALGISDRTWWRWRRDGVPDTEADNAAITLDSHPGLVWPTWHLGQPPIESAPPRETDVAC